MTLGLGTSATSREIKSNGSKITWVVANSGTAIPGGIGQFSTVLHPVIAAGTVAFVGNDDFGAFGVYKYEYGVLAKVMDLNDPVPDHPGIVFSTFSLPDISNGNIGFNAGILRGNGSLPPPHSKANRGAQNGVGLYAEINGEFREVLSTFGILDNKQLGAIKSTPQMLSGTSAVFGATFRDGTTAIYRADYVE